MSKYPEHDKLLKVSEQSQICGEFLEWIKGGYEGSPSYHLLAWREEADVPRWIHERTGERVSRADRRSVQNPDWYPAGYYSPPLNTQALLAEFFDIDQDKIEAEKRAMLAELAEVNA